MFQERKLYSDDEAAMDHTDKRQDPKHRPLLSPLHKEVRQQHYRQRIPQRQPTNKRYSTSRAEPRGPKEHQSRFHDHGTQEITSDAKHQVIEQ
jgi:hypothetical protein